MNKTKLILLFSASLCAACGTTVRDAGQAELFDIQRGADGKRMLKPVDGVAISAGSTAPDAPPAPRRFIPQIGDYAMFPTDPVCIRVDSVYLADKSPLVLLPNADLVVFSDIWENSAMGYNTSPMTNIIFVGKRQMVPSRLNFLGNVAYGPTFYKINPLKIRFTLMFLQQQEGNNYANIADQLENLADKVPGYGHIASESLRALKDVLASLPNVISFDFEMTFLPIDGSQEKGGGQFLRYGSYAVVETKSRGHVPGLGGRFLLHPGDAGNLSMLPNGGLIDGTFDGQDRAVGQLDSKTGHMTARTSYDTAYFPTLPTNYLVFSILPTPVTQRDDVLSTASAMNQTLINSMTSATGSGNATAKSVYSVVSQFQSDLHEVQVKSLIYEAARQYFIEHPDNFDFNAFVASLYTGNTVRAKEMTVTGPVDIASSNGTIAVDSAAPKKATIQEKAGTVTFKIPEGNFTMGDGYVLNGLLQNVYFTLNVDEGNATQRNETQRLFNQEVGRYRSTLAKLNQMDTEYKRLLAISVVEAKVAAANEAVDNANKAQEAVVKAVAKAVAADARATPVAASEAARVAQTAAAAKQSLDKARAQSNIIFNQVEVAKAAAKETSKDLEAIRTATDSAAIKTAAKDAADQAKMAQDAAYTAMFAADTADLAVEEAAKEAAMAKTEADAAAKQAKEQAAKASGEAGKLSP